MKKRSLYTIIDLFKPVAFLLSVILFSFCSCSEELSIEPKLNTIQVDDTEITSTTAVLKGEFLIIGNMKIIEYGIEISKSQLFSPSTAKSIQGAPSLGVFQVEFTGLESNTLYYYKAYALINTAQVYSQNALHFTTKR